MVELARQAGLPLVAAGDVHYHARARLALQDVLTAIRLGTTVEAAGEHLFANAERYLKSPEEMAARFAARPRRWRARWKSPSGRRFRSTSCATNIRKSFRRRAKRRWSISRGWPGAARPSAIRPACPKKSASWSSTSCG